VARARSIRATTVDRVYVKSDLHQTATQPFDAFIGFPRFARLPPKDPISDVASILVPSVPYPPHSGDQDTLSLALATPRDVFPLVSGITSMVYQPLSSLFVEGTLLQLPVESGTDGYPSQQLAMISFTVTLYSDAT